MGKKLSSILFVLVLALSLLAVSTRAQATLPAGWPGSWQFGGDMTNEIAGCGIGEGFARFTAIYNPQNQRVYFLGGRCESGVTTGTIFYYQPSTEEWLATGEQLDTPVSNYQAVVIPEDETGQGPVYYIIGGRTASGSMTSAIQVYYPNTNTATTKAGDSFIGGAYTPGGVVAVNGNIYVFGGFDGANMYAGSYKYDPLAAAGSRWTDLNCDLPTVRSYIATVAIGSKIYAMGGDQYDGINLIELDDTLVLDTDIPGACWQDDVMADMPAPNGDAPAVYINENMLAGSILVAGGTWPTPNAWVFRYQVEEDQWTMLPELEVARRDEAAVYIPAAAGVGKGMPGVWVFGGYDITGGNNMTNTTEYFANPAGLPTFLPLVKR